MVVRVLGDVGIATEAGWRRAGPAKQAATLAVLAISANTFVSKEVLVHRVWGSAAPPSVSSALYAHVARLRKLLQPLDRAAIVSGGAGYRLDISAGHVDLFTMRALATRAAGLSEAGQPERGVELWRQAERLWRGHPLGNIDGEWATRTRHGLERERLAILVGLFDAELALGNHARVLDALAEAAAAHPWSEAITERLMLALYRCGMQAEALAQFNEFGNRLRDDHDAQVGTALKALQRRILQQDPELAADHQDTHTAEPVSTGRPGPRQLPPPPAGFVGREPALDQLDRWHAVRGDKQSPATVVIAGMAGVGKTALALRWAHRVAAEYDGQLFADLRGFGAQPPRNAADIQAAFLRALGVPGADIPDNPQDRIALYRSTTADRRLLMLLDNVANADQVRPLLPTGDGTFVLVTSRNLLSGLVAMDGARRIGVEVLSEAEARRTLAELIPAEAVAAEPAAVDRLAELCGRLPLALRIAGANLGERPELGIAEFAAELAGDGRLGSLAVPDDDSATVRAAFAASYQQLEPTTQQVFRQLGVVAGPNVSVSAVAALCGISTGTARAAMHTLVTANIAEPVGAGHFRLHDLIKQFAHELLDAAAAQTARRRLFEWYTHAARAASEAISATALQLSSGPESVMEPVGFDDPASAMAWFDAEAGNLMATIRTAVDADAGTAAAAWLLADALRLYYAREVDIPAWREAARLGLTAAERHENLPAVAAMNYLLSLHAKITGDNETAADRLGRALEAAGKAGDVQQAATAHASLADMYLRHGELDTAIGHCEEVLATPSQLSERHLMITFNVLGGAYRERGDLAESVEVFRRNVELLSDAGGHKLTPALSGLALTYLELGELSQATRCAERAFELSRESRAYIDQVVNGDTLARIQLERGEITMATELATAALDLVRQRSNRLFEAPVLVSLSRCHHHDPARAIDAAEEALALARELELPWTEVEAGLALALAHQTVERYDEAVRVCGQALDMARSKGYRPLAGKILNALAEIRRATGEFDQARMAAREAFDIHHGIGHRLGEERSRSLLSEVEAEVVGTEHERLPNDGPAGA